MIRFHRSKDCAKTVLFFLCIMLPAFAVLGELASTMEMADQEYDQRFLMKSDEPLQFLADYRSHIQAAIELYEESSTGLSSLPVQSASHVLNRLSQLNYEFAKILILRNESQTQIIDHLLRGKGYGFRSLELHAGFDRERFVDTLRYVTDPAALVWTANCWGSWLGYNPIEGFFNLSKVQKMYERAIAVDEEFWDGSALIGLGALLATTPSMMGGDTGQARQHFERALRIAPSYLPISAVYAESYGFTHSFGARNGIRDSELIEERLAFVETTPAGKTRPFWNWEAKAESALLRLELERFSR